MQPALSATGASEVPGRLRAARAVAPVRLRLADSDEDVNLSATAKLHVNLDAAGLEHDYAMAVGPHGYTFNRGPGCYELLLWHDRVLARE